MSDFSIVEFPHDEATCPICNEAEDFDGTGTLTTTPSYVELAQRVEELDRFNTTLATENAQLREQIEFYDTIGAETVQAAVQAATQEILSLRAQLQDANETLAYGERVATEAVEAIKQLRAENETLKVLVGVADTIISALARV